MPIWHVLHPSSIFTDAAEKAALAKVITGLYTRGGTGLPAFYVNVFFHKFEASDMFYGAQPIDEIDGVEVKKWDKPFVHFEIDQIARHMPDEETATWWCHKVDAALKPFVADKGYDWEFHIDETPRLLWRINGLAPPPFQSQAERRWAVENKSSVFTKEEAEAKV
jgi:hypothetical protein